MVTSELEKIFHWKWLKYLDLSELVFEGKDYEHSKGEDNIGRRWAYKQDLSLCLISECRKVLVSSVLHSIVLF